MYRFLFFFFLAVQHERGPRKPKFKDSSDPHSPIKPNHHHHHPIHQLSHPLAHHHRLSVPTPTAHQVYSAKLAFDMSKIPSSLAAAAAASEGGAALYASSGMKDPAAAAYIGASSAGLLQMLLNAEKSQELIWNSVKLNPGVVSLSGSKLGLEHSQSFGGFPGSGMHPLCPPQLLSPTSESSAAGGRRGSGASGLLGFSPHAAANRESLQEITARLLFMVIRWVKCLPTFQTLSKTDQVIK